MNIEWEFKKCRDIVSKVKSNGNKHRSVIAVLQLMYDKRNIKCWWFAWEFIDKFNSKHEYLSHRAPARASDLAIHYPELVEDRKIGRFKVYRLRTENIKEVRSWLK